MVADVPIRNQERAIADLESHCILLHTTWPLQWQIDLRSDYERQHDKQPLLLENARLVEPDRDFASTLSRRKVGNASNLLCQRPG